MREALARGGNRSFTSRIFPNGSHSLTELPAKRRMAPGVFDTLRSWLRQHVRGLKPPVPDAETMVHSP
jgi:hypothetical protein